MSAGKEEEHEKLFYEYNSKLWTRFLEDKLIFQLKFDRTAEENLYRCLIIERMKWLKKPPSWELLPASEYGGSLGKEM